MVQTETRSRRRSRDPGFLILLFLGLLAAWPFLARAGLPAATDAELHVFRLAELSRLVRGGEVYPRWAPDFYFGYGYPIFNYYAPLAYYLGLPVTLIPGLDAVSGVKFVFVLAFFAGAAGIYGFVRANWGRQAALVGATVYLYAPFIQYVDPHARGDLAESLSFATFALALWALDSLRRRGGGVRFLVSVVAVAAVILAHNLMAMVFFAMLLAWVIWQIVPLALRRERTGVLFLMPLALVLGLGLAAFFWLPVVLEQNAVNLSSLIGSGSHFDYRNHFLSLAQLLGSSRWLDWGATEAAFSLNLGLGPWLIASLGVVALVTRQARAWYQAAFFGLSALLLLVLMLPLSQFLWATVPYLPYLQFPWRLLGPTAAVLAVLAGVGIEAFTRVLRRWSPKTAAASAWLPSLFVAILLLLALPLSMIPPWPGGQWDTSTRAVMVIETQGRWLGTTSTADFVPATVEVIPKPEDQLLRDLGAERSPDRVNRETLPAGAVVTADELSPLHTRYLVSSPQPFLLRLFQFDFPGWQARVDDAVVATQRGQPEGFLIVPVPAGEHIVDVEFVDTAVRSASWTISGMSLLLAALVALLLRRQTMAVAEQHRLEAVSWRRQDLGLIIVSVAAVMVHILGMSFGWFHFRSSGDEAIPADNDVFVNYGDQIALIGFDAPQSIRAGDSLPLTLYWKAEDDLEISYQVFVHLQRVDGTIVAQSDKLNPGEFPTRHWPTDRYVRDLHKLRLPADLPPGEYTLSTGLWVQAEGWRLPVLDENGRQVGDHYILRTFKIP